MANIKQYERLYFPQPINIIPDAPAKYDQHWHSFTEMLYYPPNAPSYELPSVTIDQVTYNMKPGDILFIWSSEMHSVDSNNDHALIGLQFPASLMTELPEFASYAHLFRTFHLIDHTNPEMQALSEYMQAKILHIMELRKANTPFHGVEELISLYEFFIQFGMYLKQTLLPKELYSRQGNSRTIDKINQACRYIAENCDKDLTLETVAEKTGFSACYFSRVFKQTTNCNFVEYLTLQRLKRAQTLLSDSDIAITNIAMESGFKSISTFNRVFQKYKGCAPSEFKKHYYR